MLSTESAAFACRSDGSCNIIPRAGTIRDTVLAPQDTRTFCSPVWQAQFPFDGRDCQLMQWASEDDRSAVPRPLASPGIQLDQAQFRGGTTSGFSFPETSVSNMRVHIPLLVLIFTECANAARRRWQRETWLSFKWHREHDLGAEAVFGQSQAQPSLCRALTACETSS